MKLEAGTLKKLENKCFTRCSKSARVFASKRNTLDHFVANKDAEKWVTQTLHTHKYLAYNLAASKQLVYGVLPALHWRMATNKSPLLICVCSCFVFRVKEGSHVSLLFFSSVLRAKECRI